MKKMIIDIVLSCLCLLLAGSLAINYLSTYEMQGCEVVAVEGDEVVVENRAGHLWAWEDTDAQSYEVGDVVTLVMNINGTDEDFTDDTVKEVMRESSKD